MARSLVTVLAVLAFLMALVIQDVHGRIFYDQLEDEDYRLMPVRNVKRNRMCLLNAGLSQGCDLSDILQAKNSGQQVHELRRAWKTMIFSGND
ncbi:unnamed protein product [Caenorhabditis auriculariae]|uniref:Uncharacterized protein n=1 Tax=Caenorhabditis auriculariae TaxID=2777116 RepID=A0A8S1HN84_9PELO|nr:unnamed protein product [Caenorhabditis auriculariae]